MRKFLQIALGVLAAIGGFVDIGDLVFTTQAGAAYGYGLLWAVPIGVVGIVVYAEMCGRVACVTRRPVMTVVRQRLGFGIGLGVLVASVLLTLLTLAAEVGGVALVLDLLFDAGYPLMILASVMALILVVWALNFAWLERIFGYGGLLLLVFAVAALVLPHDWSTIGGGFVPQAKPSPVYAYFAVGLIAAALMPYEVYFYSSGVVEERWTPADIGLNRINAILGFGLGGFLAVSLMVVSAQVFNPLAVKPEFIGSTALMAQVPLGETGLVLALLGIMFAVGGAAVDTSFAGAYNLAQFFGWEWGKHRRPIRAPRFTIGWIVLFLLGYVIISTGIDPVQLTEYAVVFSVVALPFTYLPILLIARDRTFMGEHANGPLSSLLGWIYLVVIVVVSIVAIPLLFAAN